MRGNVGHLLIYISPTELWGALWVDGSICMRQVCACFEKNRKRERERESALQLCAQRALNAVIQCMCPSHTICFLL